MYSTTQHILIHSMSSSATTKRRTTGSEESTTTPMSSIPPRDREMSTSPLSPFLPTTLEKVLLATYPIILILGSTFSLLDPSTRTSTYNPTTQSHQPPGPSYFAQKTNVFNVFFVKQGWFWISLSYFLFLFTHPFISSFSSPQQPQKQNNLVLRRRVQGIVRWVIVTGWWIAITKWFFGPPIMDRAFTLTGGTCEVLREKKMGMDVDVGMGETKEFVTGVACKAVGGTWKGGHDISGHVFMLVLGSMFLSMEVLHVVLRAMKWEEERLVVAASGRVRAVDEVSVVGNKDLVGGVKGDGVWNIWAKVALGVSGLSVWMLLMTAAYFHTWFEKFNGLIVALTGIFAVYFLPRAIPTLRSITGMPGI